MSTTSDTSYFSEKPQLETHDIERLRTLYQTQTYEPTGAEKARRKIANASPLGLLAFATSEW